MRIATATLVPLIALLGAAALLAAGASITAAPGATVRVGEAPVASTAAVADDRLGAAPSAHHSLVERAVAYHGGDRYEASETTMTITSANGSFDLRVRRQAGLYEIEVTGAMADGTPRRAVLTNDTVREWRGGVELALDEEGAARARRFVQARVWFPFLPYGLLGEAVRHEDQGHERWGEQTLRRVKVTFAAVPGEKPPDEYAFWLDPETGRVEQYAYAYDQGTPQAGLRFRPARGHRRVGGLLFFDVDNLGVDGRADLSVDLVDPAFVGGLEAISAVALSAIEVRALEAP
jgi:hypothetical protein